MEYRLPNSNDKESIVQYLQEFFLNDEMERVLLGCHSNNVASSTVIRKCGGALVVKPHFIPDDFCKLFQSKSPVIKCGNDNDSKLFQS